MKRVQSLLIILAVASVASVADDKSPRDSFNEFRKSLLNDYASFRDGVMKDYANFLEGIWAEYDSFKGEKRDSTPKPVTAPVAPEQPAAPESQPAPIATPTPTVTPKPEPKVTPAPTPTPEAVTPVAAPADYTFDFYGLPFQIPQMEVKVTNRLSDPKSYAAQWRSLADDPNSAKLVKNLTEVARKHNLNDYLTFDLVRHYVAARYPDAHSSARSALTQYILASMGYDARVATTDSGEGVLLLPFKQRVYGIQFLNIDNRRYYIFAESKLPDGVGIRSCQLPKDAAKGEMLNLELQALNIPMKEQPFDLAYGPVHLTGTVNANLFPIIYRYPQMSMDDYTSVVLQPELRRSLVSQVREQLGDRPQLEAVDALCAFTQKAFEYATDEEAHGFEKPYFFEEILFYPQCDCEDRAMFYTYLLWNALGVENQLIAYPGHESAAVALNEPIKGDTYTYGGRTFYVSDPTYINARTGMCMPDYKYTKPTIDHHYH